MPHESHPNIAGLRRRLARITGEAEPRAETAGRLASGHADFDAALGGGLATGRVHEFFAADALDAASAAAFAALMALRTPGAAPLVWLRTADAARRGGHIYAPGIAELGGDPDRLLLIEAPDPKLLLACANDAIRCAGSAAVVVESWGKFPLLDLTAGRRLALGARDAGTTLLMLRLNAVRSSSGNLPQLSTITAADPAQRIASLAQASNNLGSGASISSSRSGSPPSSAMPGA